MFNVIIGWFKNFWAKFKNNAYRSADHKHVCECDKIMNIDCDLKNVEIDFTDLKETLEDMEKKLSKPNRSKKSMKKVKKVCKKKREI